MNGGEVLELKRIGIVGAGFIGRAVARLAVQHGFEVMISNSRSPKTLGSAMVSIRCFVGTTQNAVEFGDVVVLAVPFHATTDIDPAPFAGKILLDADNYYPLRDGTVDALEAGSTTTSEITQRHFAGARVVKAFNAILERDIETTGAPSGTPDRRALPIAGDDPEAKVVVSRLLDQLGFDVVDAGVLKEGWRFERAPAGLLSQADSRRAPRRSGRRRRQDGRRLLEGVMRALGRGVGAAWT